MKAAVQIQKRRDEGQKSRVASALRLWHQFATLVFDYDAASTLPPRTGTHVEAFLIYAPGSLNTNPIRRVVSLLLKIYSHVIAESAEEKELFVNSIAVARQDLVASLHPSVQQMKDPKDTSSLDEAVAQCAQLKTQVAEHQSDSAGA